MCRNPFISAGSAYGCGQCMPCRYNRRRIWQHRIMIEAGQYEDNAFVNLTYDDENMPRLPDGRGNLEPSHLQAFLKRLRYHCSPVKIRFYGVGEYGDKSDRPHYHIAVFGMRSCAYGQSQYSSFRSRCCVQCELVRDTWGKGNVYLGTLEADSAGYVCGYVTKKMTMRDDPRLNGRNPEFARMSLRPGIGASGMWDVASVLLAYDLVDSRPDVPGALTRSRKDLPLGRYLTKLLRRYVGRDEKAPQAVLDEVASELLPLRFAARSSESDPSFKSHLVRSSEGRYRNFEARRKLRKKGGSL